MPHRKRKSGDDSLFSDGSKKPEKKKRWSWTSKEESECHHKVNTGLLIDDFHQEEAKVRKKKKKSKKNGERSGRSLSPTSDRAPPPLPAISGMSKAEQESILKRNAAAHESDTPAIKESGEFRLLSPSFSSVEEKYAQQKSFILKLVDEMKEQKCPQKKQVLLTKKEVAVELLSILASARLEFMENQRRHFIQSWMQKESQGEVKTFCIVFVCPDILVLEKVKHGFSLVSSMIINDTTNVRRNQDTPKLSIESPHLQETLTLFPDSMEIAQLWVQTLSSACRAQVKVEDIKKKDIKQNKHIHIEPGQLSYTKYDLMRTMYSDSVQITGGEVCSLKAGTLEDWCLWVLVSTVEPTDSDIIVSLFAHFPRYTTPEDLIGVFEKFKANIKYTVPCLNLPHVTASWLSLPNALPEKEIEMGAREKLMLLTDNCPGGSTSPELCSIKHRRYTAAAFNYTYPTDTPIGQAQQITHVTEGFLISLRLAEFMEKRWEKRETSPRFHAFIDWSNRLNYWVSYSILSLQDQKERLNKYKFFVNVAQELHNLRNYQACSSILGGLSTIALRRLKEFQCALTGKTASRFQKLNELYSPVNNFAAFKRLPEEFPNIPLLGIHMKSLLYAEEFLKDYVDDERTIINIEKCVHITSILKKLYVFRRRSSASLYPNIGRDEEAIAELQMINPPDEDGLYDLSQKISSRSSRNIEEELLVAQEKIRVLQVQTQKNDSLRETLLDLLEEKKMDPNDKIVQMRELIVSNMVSCD